MPRLRGLTFDRLRLEEVVWHGLNPVREMGICKRPLLILQNQATECIRETAFELDKLVALAATNIADKNIALALCSTRF